MPPPETTALGALLAHITGGHLVADERSFQPMNINYGLLPPLEAPDKDADGKRLKAKERGLAKKRAMSRRALADLDHWLQGDGAAAAAE
jgi:methylenetetrahydrofolate--tRNA-(uracil-5-)-methyltransferase